jgi:hypothetical protein
MAPLGLGSGFHLRASSTLSTRCERRLSCFLAIWIRRESVLAPTCSFTFLTLIERTRTDGVAAVTVKRCGRSYNRHRIDRNEGQISGS